MMNETKTYTVHILHERYTITSNETHEHITKAADHVERLLDQVIANHKQLEPKKAACLVALQLASALQHEQDRVQAMVDREQELIALTQTV